jgi:hypothetical protein
MNGGLRGEVDNMQGKFEMLSRRVLTVLDNFDAQKRRSEQLLTAVSFLRNKVNQLFLRRLR